MEAWASKEATEAVLKSLGFVYVEDSFWDAPSKWQDCFGSLQADVYQCRNDYYCVRLNGDAGWSAPVTWSGPKADWDKSNVLDEFVEWMDKYYP